MKRFLALVRNFVPLLIFFVVVASCSRRSGSPKVLIFSKTAGFYHNSIPNGIAAIEKLGKENGFEVDTTANAAMFTEDTLKQYSAVIFLSTTGDVLNHYQEADFRRYIEAGGGYVGIHAAADTEYHWGWYGRLVGGYFVDHPAVQEGTLHVQDANHPATDFLPEEWTRTDEWYSYKNLNKKVHVLMTLDEGSYKGGTDMGNHPIAWYHEFDGGRAFYTGLGHTKASFTEEPYLKHILGGIEYAIGENYRLDYDAVTTERVPEANRFSKTTLVEGTFTEPTEMTILPNHDVLVAQRRGEILLYKSRDSTVSRAGQLDVYWKTDVPDVNAEEGLLGIKADPDFKENNFVYVFYSPADTSVNRLSRFTLKNDTLQDETHILQFYSKRDICCHTGGSIAFDNDGLLYLSTGDNSTPFNQPDQPYVLDGYAPLDQRKGFEQYDARRTSGNAGDLRGSILRIRVNEDGSYDIPEANLYPKEKEGTRPEIYVQGNRNPYRISVDQKNGYLYWGEVGPDAPNDSMATRGPRGYDEINQAREAGFFGWPMFVGNNYAYHRYDYSTGEPGKAFDPRNPQNLSPNNTGIENLPPAQPAFIWYPYGASQEFPQVGEGGRNAMAGPVYYTDMYPEGKRLPEYYDGKLFIYDWIRGWIKVVTMQPNGNFDKMEPFMPETAFNAPIDMEVGPDGSIYILEYGSGWFSQNPDAGLSRIDFNAGNRPPLIEDIAVDKTSGTLPFTIEATVAASDPEQDPLSYTWDLGDGTTKKTSEPKLTHTFEEVGAFMISVEVQDTEGHTAKSTPVSVYAGNAAPVVNINIEGNSTFYFPDQPVTYSVGVEDKDGPPASENESSLFVSADYVQGNDMAEASQGHKVMTEAMSGKNLIVSFNCQACHNIDSESVGPAYTAVAQRYQDSTDIDSYLSDKIINGSSGVWGERAMPAHQDLSEADARKIVAWIMSLNEDGQTQESLPKSGEVKPALGKKLMPNGLLILSASYTDRGTANAKPLSGNASVSLRNNTIGFGGATTLHEYSTMSYEGNLLMMVPQKEGSFALPEIDLTDIASLEIMAAAQEPVSGDYVFELRLDGADGKKVGEGVRKGGTGKQQGGEGPYVGPFRITIDTNTPEGVHDLYFVSKPVDGEASGQLILSGITFKNK